VRWFGRELLSQIEAWTATHPEAAPARPRGERVARPLQRRALAAAEGIEETDLYRRMRAWRAERARAEGVPAFTIFSDRTLRELATARPRDIAELLQTWGLGSSRVARFGSDLLAAINEVPSD
jgi:ATP-dependent DNA helicase RecQ